MLPLLWITSISRPRSILAVYSTSGAISTRACRIDCFYGSRFRPKRTWSPKLLKQSWRRTNKKAVTTALGRTLREGGQCMSNGSKRVVFDDNGFDYTDISVLLVNTSLRRFITFFTSAIKPQLSCRSLASYPTSSAMVQGRPVSIAAFSPVLLAS